MCVSSLRSTFKHDLCHIAMRLEIVFARVKPFPAQIVATILEIEKRNKLFKKKIAK